MRVLKLTFLDGGRALVNTAHIVCVQDDGEHRTLTLSSPDEMNVTDSFEAILHAWRYGDNQGETEVFDVP